MQTGAGIDRFGERGRAAVTHSSNKGFTLVELLVVVAIIAICTAIMEASLSTISSSQAHECANEIGSLLSQCRIRAMSRSANVYVKLYRDASGNLRADYVENNAVVSSDAVGGTRCGASYTAGGVETPLDSSGRALYLSFARDTGAFRTLQPDGINDAASPCTSIEVSGGGRIYTVSFFIATGLYHIEVST